MRMFVGNTFTKVEDVRSQYSKISTYDLSDEDNIELIKETIVLESDYDERIRQIYSDINDIIRTLERNHDSATAIDDLKILAEKLY